MSINEEVVPPPAAQVMDRIARVDVLPVNLPVRRGEDESRGQAQQHVFLRLETEGGAVGWGEARALPSWTGETIESITSALQSYFLPVLLGANPFARNAIMATMDEIVTGSVGNGMPSAKAAVDIALHDLQGRLTGVSVHALLGGKKRSEVRLSYSLRSGGPDEMREAAMRGHDAACLKIKLGGDPGEDAERLAAVHEVAGRTDLWLDANQTYTPTSALQFLERIRSLKRVACLQQPVPAADWLGMARLRERSPLPLAVDEGCFAPAEVLRIAELKVADLVVVKLCKAGGLRDAVLTAQLARHAGMEVLGSGLTESGIGLAAALHVYSVIDLRLPPQLNGVQFLEDLCVSGLKFSGNRSVKVPDGPGLGVEVDEDRIRAHVVDL